MAMLAPPKEEFTRVRNVDGYITVHGVLAQHIDAKFFASLGESELSVQGEHVGEDPPALAIVRKLQKLLGEFTARRLEGPMQGSAIEIVNALVLMMERFMQDTPT